MESVKLYLFKTEKINFVNLLQFCFYLSRRDLYQPCLPVFSDSYLDVTKGELVYTFSPENPNNFRNLNWNEKLDLLDTTLSSTDAPIVIGSSSIDQILLLNNRYSDISQTISHCYTEEDYDFLLTYFVNQHLTLQSKGCLPLTEHDLQLRSDPTINLFSYYKNSFDQQGILPKSITYSTDYVIPVKDFFNKDKFFQHLNNIGADSTDEAIHYYNQWWELQKSFFTMEINYETN